MPQGRLLTALSLPLWLPAAAQSAIKTPRDATEVFVAAIAARDLAATANLCAADAVALNQRRTFPVRAQGHRAGLRA